LSWVDDRSLHPGAIGRWLSELLHVHDTARRTAAAYAIGVFFDFSPFLGFHTVLGLACAFVLNLNRVAVLLGVYSNLPWIVGPYYAFAAAGGAVLLRTRLPPEFGSDLRALFDHSVFDREFWQDTTMFAPLFWPYLVGSTSGAVLLAIVAFRVALAFVAARRRAATCDSH
jgi:uncharacterized protein (DUF2062 family)